MDSGTVRTVTTLLQVLGGLPVIAYPGVLIAGVMGLAGHKTGQESALLKWASGLFLWGSLAYPVVPIACYIFAWRAFRDGNFRTCLLLSAVPLVFLAFLAVCMYLWGKAGKK